MYGLPHPIRLQRMNRRRNGAITGPDASVWVQVPLQIDQEMGCDLDGALLSMDETDVGRGSSVTCITRTVTYGFAGALRGPNVDLQEAVGSVMVSSPFCRVCETCGNARLNFDQRGCHDRDGNDFRDGAAAILATDAVTTA